jgi:hypothetical protein
MHGAIRRISISSGQAFSGASGTSNELSNSTRGSHHWPYAILALRIGRGAPDINLWRRVSMDATRSMAPPQTSTNG